MRILFDFSRLLRRAQHSTPTGIDRVDFAYASLLPDRCDRVHFVAGRIPRLLSPDTIRRLTLRRPLSMPAAPYSALCQFLQQPDWPYAPEVSGVQRLADPSRTSPLAGRLAIWRAYVSSRPLPSRLDGEIYINTSHTGLDNGARLQSIRARGAKIVVMLHDLIPIDYPEFCRDGEDQRHQKRLENICQSADLVLAVSHYSADRFKFWAKARGFAAPRIEIVPLGVENVFLNARAAPNAGIKPYFVCLGTIEGRKNHLFLLELWRQLTERLGSACPRLVIVGRRGWKAHPVFDLLDNSADLAKTVLEVADLDDEGIARLMAGAHGLLQPSLVEGFGLPLVEAHAMALPVVASDIPAHREISGPNVKLLDASNAQAWLDAIQMLAGNRQTIAGDLGKTHIRRWSEHVDEALERIGR